MRARDVQGCRGHCVRRRTLGGGLSRFITATGVYPVHVPKHNLFNYRQRDGRSAAYGYGLLLTGLRTGEHTILLDGNVPSAKYQIQVTYTLHVH